MSPRPSWTLAFALSTSLVPLLASCDDPSASIDAGPAGGADGAGGAAVDGAVDADALACTGADACAWLDDYLRELVSALAGQVEIAPGLTVTGRETLAERSAARTYLRDQLARWGAVTGHTYATGENVVLTLPATTAAGAAAAPLLLGAHFDSVAAGPGAADNATGTALVVAAGRYLAGLPRRDRPVIIAVFDEEELGLIGSRAYARDLVAAGTALHSAHCFDMLSYDGDDDGGVELWSPTTELAALYQRHGQARGVPIAAFTFTRSDHQAFLEQGLAAVGVGEQFVGGDHTSHYHRATDTFDKVDFDYLGAAARLALSVSTDVVVD
ncbi:MAG: M28 family peptidase [Kofleriaceae bacterium]|nr:M28 family peptidase [Kofleriaceae bacterium]